MTDRELLELAARAAGYGLPSADDHDEIGRQYDDHLGLWVKHPWGWGWFRPHIDDAQSLRLAVKLRLDIDHRQSSVNVSDRYIGTGYIPNGDNPYAATRRAIVRAAAQIQLNKEAANE